MAHLNGSNIFASIFKIDLLKKFKGLLLDATVGLAKQYQSKSIDLVKLEAAAYYVRGVQFFRNQILFLMTVLSVSIAAAVSVIVVPLMWLVLAPWPREIKLWLALLLGIIDIGLPLAILAYLLSEKKWLEISKSAELVESVMKNQSH